MDNLTPSSSADAAVYDDGGAEGFYTLPADQFSKVHQAYFLEPLVKLCGALVVFGYDGEIEMTIQSAAGELMTVDINPSDDGNTGLKIRDHRNGLHYTLKVAMAHGERQLPEQGEKMTPASRMYGRAVAD
jgi:hypothetical protein